MSEPQPTEHSYISTIRCLTYEVVQQDPAMKLYQVKYEYRGLPGVLYCPVSIALAEDPDIDLDSLLLGEVQDFILSSNEANINFNLVLALEKLLYTHLHGHSLQFWRDRIATAQKVVAEARAAGVNDNTVAALEGLLSQEPGKTNALKQASDALAQACGIPLNPDDATADQKWWYQVYGYEVENE